MDPLEDECSMEMTFRMVEAVRQCSSTAEIHDWRCGRVSELHIHMLSLPPLRARVLLISNSAKSRVIERILKLLTCSLRDIKMIRDPCHFPSWDMILRD